MHIFFLFKIYINSLCVTYLFNIAHTHFFDYDEIIKDMCKRKIKFIDKKLNKIGMLMLNISWNKKVISAFNLIELNFNSTPSEASNWYWVFIYTTIFSCVFPFYLLYHLLNPLIHSQTYTCTHIHSFMLSEQ